MELEVLRLSSKAWLTQKSPNQKNQLRDDYVAKVVNFINHHPSASTVKNLLMSDKPYLISYQTEKILEPTIEGAISSTRIRVDWFVTDLENVFNITSLMYLFTLPACPFEIIDKEHYPDGLNEIISNSVFSANDGLSESEREFQDAVIELNRKG